MRLLPDDRDLVPALPLRTGHEPDRLLRCFEDRPLLDMRLEIGGDRPFAHRLGTRDADPRELAPRFAPVTLSGRGRPSACSRPPCTSR